MKSALYLALVLLALTGITSPLEYSNEAQAHEPELVNKSVNNTGMFLRIKVVTYSDLDEVNQAYKDYLEERGRETSDIQRVNGWARWSNGPTQYCIIHVVEPLTAYDQVFRTWGHELAHCVYGPFHK